MQGVVMPKISTSRDDIQGLVFNFLIISVFVEMSCWPRQIRDELGTIPTMLRVFSRSSSTKTGISSTVLRQNHPFLRLRFDCASTKLRQKCHFFGKPSAAAKAISKPSRRKPGYCSCQGGICLLSVFLRSGRQGDGKTSDAKSRQGEDKECHKALCTRNLFSGVLGLLL